VLGALSMRKLSVVVSAKLGDESAVVSARAAPRISARRVVRNAILYSSLGFTC
jgi:hypothetical protein